jgi:hypothetical protein
MYFIHSTELAMYLAIEIGGQLLMDGWLAGLRYQLTKVLH